MSKFHYGDTYNGHTLKTSDKYASVFSVDILKALESLLSQMTANHSKVFIVMFTLRYPPHGYTRCYRDNALLSRYKEALILHCERKSYDPLYIWARENSADLNVHYHFMLLLNGNLIQNGHGIKNKAEELWGNCLGINGSGYVHHSDKGCYINQPGGMMLRRSDPNFRQLYENSFTWGSYLAKCDTKGNAPPFVNQFGCSRAR